jgi:hypothetical protein
VVVQKSQAELVAESGVAILGPLMARPLWLLGVALQVVGLVFHGFALTEAPVTVVQPIIASGIAFLVLFAALILRERPSARELSGCCSRLSACQPARVADPGTRLLAPLDADDFAYAVAERGGARGALCSRSGARGRARVDGRGRALIGSAAGVGQGMSDARV